MNLFHCCSQWPKSFDGVGQRVVRKDLYWGFRRGRFRIRWAKNQHGGGAFSEWGKFSDQHAVDTKAFTGKGDGLS